MDSRISKLLFSMVLLSTPGCAAYGSDELGDSIDDSFVEPDGKSDAFGVAEGSYLALGVLEVVDRLTLEELDHQVPLNARAARNIVEARSHGPIQTLAELDAIPYVGLSAFNTLANYAEAEGFVGRCGDGNVQSIEACDDGNLIGGDGCSAQCESEGPPSPGGPPYESRPVIHGVMDGSYEGIAILAVANTRSLPVLDDDVDLDTLTAKNIFYERGSGYPSLEALGAISGVDAETFQKLLTYAVANELVPSCGDGRRQPVMELCDDGNLNVNDGCDSACRLESVCGDGLVEFYETCDDGNTVDEDGCSAICEIEIKQEENDFINGEERNATPIGTYRHLGGTMRGREDIDVWRFTIDRPSAVSMDIWGGYPDGSCRVFSHASPTGSTVSLFDPESTLRDEFGRVIADISERCGTKRSDRNGEWDATFELAPGTYYIRLRGQNVGWGWDTGYTVSYQIELHIDSRGPVCGNGVVDDGEACDDGNGTSRDGCSAACAFEYFAERESNDNISSSNAIANYRFVEGTISTGDADVFGFRLSARETVSISTRNSLADCPFDGYLELYDQAGTLLAEDDDSAGDYCPLITETLEAGTYFVKLRHTRTNHDGGSYLLEIAR